MSIILRSGSNVLEAVTRSEHERKEQHIRNVEDLGGKAKLMSFTQHGITFIEKVRTQETTTGRDSIKYVKHSKQ